MRARVLPVVALWVVVGACGDDPKPTVGVITCAQAVDGRVTVVAHDLAWDPPCVDAVVGPIVITVDNRDSGVNHNLHLTDARDEPKTALQRGPVRQELAVDLPVGTYEFVCDIHPNMVGRLQVDDANSGDP